MPRPAVLPYPGLSARQCKIVRVIEDSVRSNGYGPSLREIAEAVGLASTSSVSYQLSTLERKGYLTREAGRPRTAVIKGPGLPAEAPAPARAPVRAPVRPPRPRPGVTPVPLVGQIAA